PDIRSSFFESLYQAGSVDDLRDSQDAGRVLPFATGQAHRWNVACRDLPIARRSRLVGLVRLVRILLEVERHSTDSRGVPRGVYPRRGPYPRRPRLAPEA